MRQTGNPATPKKGLPEAATEVDVSRRANKMMHLKEHNEITAEKKKEKQLTKGCLQIQR